MPLPGNGTVPDPGFKAVTPGSGATTAAPVSDCHHVSTIGQRPPPTLRCNHNHASGLMASPTEPSSRNELRSKPAGSSGPCFMNVRTSVGAV